MFLFSSHDMSFCWKNSCLNSLRIVMLPSLGCLLHISKLKLKLFLNSRLYSINLVFPPHPQMWFCIPIYVSHCPKFPIHLSSWVRRLENGWEAQYPYALSVQYSFKKISWLRWQCSLLIVSPYPKHQSLVFVLAFLEKYFLKEMPQT